MNSRLEIRIRTDNRAVLPSQFHQTRLEILPAGARNLAPHGRAAGEVDLAHGGVFNHGVDDLGGVLRPARDQIKAAHGQAGIVEGTGDSPVAAGGEFGGFEDGGVASSERAGGGADAKDVGSVPFVFRLAIVI